jgi:hypothetical protein
VYGVCTLMDPSRRQYVYKDGDRNLQFSITRNDNSLVYLWARSNLTDLKGH